MKKFAGKVAIVTGSSRGIGKEIAMKLAHEGAKNLNREKSTMLNVEKSLFFEMGLLEWHRVVT
ncbi:SDR family NAD(P)-dependent oxidoreductase [Nostoc sp.]|uniref:SDR family NAD(P)-dependent oxidoreductase n=1 Tax=Nostoc sp. TaxID=1180 RepID=UPI002FF67B18